MKALRCLTILFSLSFVLMLQGCGDDTAGALTMTAPTSTNETPGVYSVSTTVTYAPPSGKSAQGVVVTLNVEDLSGHVSTSYHTLSSDSNSFVAKFYIDQSLVSANPVTITASIGSMASSVSAVIPKYTAPLAVNPTTVTFAIGSVLDSTVDVAYTGGTPPVAVASSDNLIVVASIASSSATGGVVTITLKDNSAGTATVTLTDAAGVTVQIPVVIS